MPYEDLDLANQIDRKLRVFDRNLEGIKALIILLLYIIYLRNKLIMLE